MQAREINAILTDSSATLKFFNPPAHKERYSPGITINDLKKVQTETHRGIPPQNFIRNLSDPDHTNPAIRQVGYAIYSSAFSSMAHLAFSQHKPMEIRPDDIHLLVLQGISRFLQIYPEDFRQSLVSFTGKKELEIRDDALTDRDPAVWSLLPEGFASLIREDVPGEVVDVLLQDYSETSQVEREVKAVTLMGTFSAYFQYAASTLCFIPEFILKGTEKDWEMIARIPERLIQLLNLRECSGNEKENGAHLLCRWLTRLTPILQQMYTSRCGYPDASFWQSFYKFQESSGTDRVTGNIVYFFPFLHKRVNFHLHPGEYVLNEYIMQRKGVTLSKRTSDSFHGGEEYAGPDTTELPANVIDVNFKWKRSGQEYDMGMKAGIFAFNVGARPNEVLNTHTDYTIFYRSKQPAKPALDDQVRVVNTERKSQVNSAQSARVEIPRQAQVSREQSATTEQMQRELDAREAQLNQLRELMTMESLDGYRLFGLYGDQQQILQAQARPENTGKKYQM